MPLPPGMDFVDWIFWLFVLLVFCAGAVLFIKMLFTEQTNKDDEVMRELLNEIKNLELR